MAGKKFDNKKPDHTLVCKAFIDGVADVMGYGAEKYGRHNYLEGMDHSRLLAACSRHLTAYIDGQDTDPESGFCHLQHAAANLNMLLNFKDKGIGNDNRYLKDTTKVIKPDSDKINSLSKGG